MTVSMTETAASTGWGLRQGTATRLGPSISFFFPRNRQFGAQPGWILSKPSPTWKMPTPQKQDVARVPPLCFFLEMRSWFSSGGHKPKDGRKACPGRGRGEGGESSGLMAEETRSCKRKNSYGRLQGERMEIYALQVKGAKEEKIQARNHTGMAERGKRSLWVLKKTNGEMPGQTETVRWADWRQKCSWGVEPGTYINFSLEVHVMLDPFSWFFSFLQQSS